MLDLVCILNDVFCEMFQTILTREVNQRDYINNDNLREFYIQTFPIHYVHVFSPILKRLHNLINCKISLFQYILLQSDSIDPYTQMDKYPFSPMHLSHHKHNLSLQCIVLPCYGDQPQQEKGSHIDQTFVSNLASLKLSNMNSESKAACGKTMILTLQLLLQLTLQIISFHILTATHLLWTANDLAFLTLNKILYQA